MNIKQTMQKQFTSSDMQFPDIHVVQADVKAILINEVVPDRLCEDFYEDQNGAYACNAVALFQQAGLPVNSTYEILERGIYITNALKKPKKQSIPDKEEIISSLPYLEYELSLFSNVKVIMLMGDVAKKAFNMIAKQKDGKNVIPSSSTYKIRHNEWYYHNIRIMPSYIMTGRNLMIETSKVTMIGEDIANMLDLL